MSFFGGGGGGGSAPPSTTTNYVREAPGIEERKIELMDIARQVAQKPINLPDYQVAGLGSLEQQGIQSAQTTGVGAGSVNQGISTIQGAAAPVGAQQISQYLNPYQSYVTNEIGRSFGVDLPLISGSHVAYLDPGREVGMRFRVNF